MATLYSTEYLLQDFTRVNPSRLLGATRASGSLEIARFNYIQTTGTDEAASDVLYLGKLPPGAIVIPQLSSIFTSADAGTSIIVDVGTLGNADAYADGIDISAVGQVAFNSGTAPSGAQANEPMVDAAGAIDDDIICTYRTATSPTASVTLTFTIAYVLPR